MQQKVKDDDPYIRDTYIINKDGNIHRHQTKEMRDKSK